MLAKEEPNEHKRNENERDKRRRQQNLGVSWIPFKESSYTTMTY
jgi:hypothetical protein